MIRRILFFAVLTGIFVFTINAQTKQPKTVREFFNLLPQKYFPLEGCSDKPTKANCDRARREYVGNYLEVEDTANGFWKSGCDGAQMCLTMALFRRPDASYIVAVQTEFEADTRNYFLEYRGGQWFDISARVIPGFSRSNIYEPPRRGTTVAVYAKDRSREFPSRGKKLYDLVWKNGKFSVKR